MQIIDLKQMQQYYWTQITRKGDHTQEGIGQEKETKKLNVVDVLTVEE
jgi:hypothetical protein